MKETLARVRGDLDWIVMKCLEKDRARRYDTANGLAADLKRHLNNEPVLARPPSAGYRFQKAFRRNRLVFTAAAVVAAALVIGIGVSTWQVVEASRARNAEKEQRLAAQGAQAQAVNEQQRAEQTARDLRRHVYVADMNLAHAALEDENLWLASNLVRKHVPKLGEEDLRGFEWRHLWQRCQSDDFFTLREHHHFVTSAVFSPDGKFLATAGKDKTVKILEVDSLRVVATLTGFDDELCRNTLAFSPDARLLAVADRRKIWLWDTAHWPQPLRMLECQSVRDQWAPPLPVAFSPDGKTLAATEETDGLRFWDTISWRTKTVISSRPRAYARALAYSADGKTFAIAFEQQIELWDLSGESPVAGSPIPFAYVECLKLSSRGDVLAAGNYDGEVLLWDLRAARSINRWKPNRTLANGVDLSPDGAMLATAGGDQLIHLWDLATQKKLATFQGHLNEIWALTFSPDGRTLASASKDGTARLWKAASRPEEIELANSFEPLWFSRDGSTLITLGSDLDLQVWDVDRRQQLRHFKVADANPDWRSGCSISRDGKSLAIGLSGGAVEVWSLDRLKRTASFPRDRGSFTRPVFSPDGRLLAACALESATATVWDIVRGQEIARFTNTTGALAFSPDGTILAGRSPDYAVNLLDLSTKKDVGKLRGHQWLIRELAFSPDGKLLVSGAIDNTARIWDVATRKELAVLQGHKAGVHSVAFSPDGRTIATGSTDETVKLWNVATGQQLLTLKEFKADLGPLLFSPDGTTLAAGRASIDGRQRTVQLWRAPSWAEINAPEAKEKAESKQP